MCCCCLTVSYHLVLNLVDRFLETVRDVIYCRCRNEPSSQSDESVENRAGASSGGDCSTKQSVPELPDNNKLEPVLSASTKPRYVLLNDTVELQPFYYDIDRRASELLLKNRPEGTCLVRPFKLKHENIRYILSIRAEGTYFHLFIRNAGKNGMYALGLEKRCEKRFKFPSDIVAYYQLHSLECTRATMIARLKLIPLQL
ncbi:uncharacterized protein LOC131211129 [Anopheles bellator]|uniref:uncharacterized protein LOC131211129 n=1 Tax=Anopheles bellator TaxID=139047 RepID=UPI002649D45F|nr:uncharacterized protein LOC131211129 [Anopheles bellator]